MLERISQRYQWNDFQEQQRKKVEDEVEAERSTFI